jgi:hypothetical protein
VNGVFSIVVIEAAKILFIVNSQSSIEGRLTGSESAKVRAIGRSAHEKDIRTAFKPTTNQQLSNQQLLSSNPSMNSEPRAMN